MSFTLFGRVQTKLFFGLIPFILNFEQCAGGTSAVFIGISPLSFPTTSRFLVCFCFLSDYSIHERWTFVYSQITQNIKKYFVYPVSRHFILNML